jgi:hypothetical protein
MRFIRLFFCLKHIYFKQTIIDVLYFYLVVGALLGLALMAASTIENTPTFAVPLVVFIYSYLFMRSAFRVVIVDNYIRQYPKSLISLSPGEIGHSSANLELNNFDHLTPISNFGKANLFIATFDFYRRTKYGDYVAKQAYYTVLELPLDRKLPHIVFDSKSAKRRQFGSLYLKVQKLSVQGTFDQIFDTYVPQTYSIDSLSFITPEVMEVLVSARSYDIEIINDRVLLYAPLMDEKDLKSFAKKGMAIAKHLNDNIDTYRDDRLKGEARAKDVTPFARSLLKSPEKSIIVMLISGALIIDIIYFALKLFPDGREGVLLNQISLIIYFTFIANAWKVVKISRENKKAIERYRVMYHTDRGKPIKGK